MRMGTTVAAVLAATKAAPSYTFISEPVLVMRPSGKITTGRPVSTSLMTCFMASGLVESTVRCGTKRSRKENRGWLAICECTTNIASTGTSSPMSRPSKKDS